jgi:tetratricopeptide (TPR) repeat protein
MGGAEGRRVLLIGWDAADWKIIDPLIEAGRMPNLARLVEEGVMGNLATMSPILSPMLWTSIATGKRPYKHGIHGFLEPLEDGSGVRPATSTSRTVKALWNILSQTGRRSILVNWFVSHPAEPINGVCVSELYPKCPAPERPLPVLPPDTVHPSGLTDTLAALRVHPSEIDGRSLIPFVPRAAEIDQSTDGRLGQLAVGLAECASVHAAATWLLEHEQWDFAAVFYDTIDHISHTFMHYHPPRMEAVPKADFELYKDVVNETYIYHDLLLGRLLELAGEETTVVLCSDHGYHSDHLRPPWTPDLPSGPAVWHRKHGIVAIRGPGIRADQRIYGANLLGITPTVLALYGLPVGADMDDRAWTQIFDEPVNVTAVPSWETIEGPSGMHSPDRRQNPFEADAALQQLAELGYVEFSGEAEQDIEVARRESRFNLARAYMDARLFAEAAPLLEDLRRDDPDHLFVNLSLATCYWQMGRRAEGRRLAEDLIARSRDDASPAFGRPKEDPIVAVTRTKSTEGPRLVPQADLLLGMLDVEERRFESALEHLLRAEEADPSAPAVFVLLGRVYLRLRRHADAERAFRKALEIDPDEAQAHDGLAEVCLAARRNEEAGEHALQAVGLLHHFAPGHYHLGVALARLGMLERSVQAFENCVAVDPKAANPAYRWLGRLYRLLNQEPRIPVPARSPAHADSTSPAD